ncbi:MAG: Cof-type HAD-IIB family hydrolase [Clostridia bacterium]|nr:Cof-type HAD-IIB family hydrolase [Clostridia bacterium]MDH7572895.1 Cof-type HAD-IIB family hydrolase [Clostridia bacterium]
MATFRLVAVDLDGTLLNRNWEISPRAKEAVRAVRERGVFVTLATGRMYASAIRYARELELDLPLITYNGAVVKTSSEGLVIYERLLPRHYAREIIALVQEKSYPINLYFNHGGDRLYVDRISAAARRYAFQSSVPFYEVPDLRSLLDRDPIKLVVLGEEELLDALAEESRARWGRELYITKSEPTYLEYLHPEATKGRALAAVAQHLGVAREEVMAIGDSFNDVEMFRYAGLAVAMGNAREEIKAAADYVAPPNEEEGVAAVLEQFILRG